MLNPKTKNNMKKVYLLIVGSCLFVNTSIFAQIFGEAVVNTHPLTWDNEEDKSFINISPTSSWQLGKPQKSFFNAAFSGNHALVTDTVNTYQANDTSSFTLVFPDSIWNPYSSAGVRVSFTHKLHTDTLKDFCFVEFSTDSGLNWETISYSYLIRNCPALVNYSQHTNLTTGQNIYPNGTLPEIGYTFFSGTTNYWIKTNIDIIFYFPVFNSRTSQGPCWSNPELDNLLLRFSLVSDSIDTHKDGWIIDNINLLALDLGSSLKENAAINKKMLLNNLATNALFINNTENAPTNTLFTIYDIAGQQVKTGNINSEIDITNLADGMYLLQTSTTNGKMNKEKFIKTAKQ